MYKTPAFFNAAIRPQQNFVLFQALFSYQVQRNHSRKRLWKKGDKIMKHKEKMYLRCINQNLNALIINQARIYAKLLELLDKVARLEKGGSSVIAQKSK